jgi:hypothetical protein
MSEEIVLIKAELDQLEEEGRGAGFTVLDIKTEAVVEYLNTMIIREDKTGKFFRAEFSNSSRKTTLVEVRQVPSVVYEPLDN